MVPREFRYAGPGGEGIPNLPDGVGCAVGSEYCVHLLPDAGELADSLSAARARKVPVLLLTPYFRDDELKRAIPLFRSIPADADVDVAINDWGLLFTLRTLLPDLRLSIGRLLSGQKRCPRIGISPALTPEGRAWHGEGIFSSAAARNFLGREFGISGYHVDSVEWSSPACGKFPRQGAPNSLRLYVHEPFAIVTVSDRCPWLGGKSSSAIPSCTRPCRKGVAALSNPSMGGELLQRGKARFFQSVSGIPQGLPGIDAPFRILYHDLP